MNNVERSPRTKSTVVVRTRAARVVMLGAVALLVVACSSDDDNVSEEPAATVSSTSSTSAATRPTTTPTTTPDDAAGGDILAGGVTRDQVMAAVAQIDGLVEAEMQRSEVPGIAVAVVHDDEVVFAEGYGVREVGTQDPVSPETVFQLASLSKPISATAVARLVFKGVIDWDDPVRSSAPELVFSDPWVTDHITFADLYSHRSGLPGQAGNALETIGFTRDEILARLRYVPLEPFRATYSYSNFGLTAAGDAAANAAGVRFEDVMDELFDLAGMTASSARYADFEAQPDRATIHNIVDGEWVPGPTRNPDAQAPAGGISSSLNDVATWVRLQLGAGTLDGVEIVGEEALAATHAPHIVNRPAETYDGQHGSYGLGWTLATDHLGELRWAHSGAFSQGAHTSVTLLPQEQLGVVVLSNAMPVGSAEAIADQIIDQIIVGEQTQDWAEVWSARYSNLFVADETLAEPPVPATPALPDDAYVGSYANEYYGTFEVIADGDGLAVVQGPAGVEFALTHWDANTFTWISDPELPEVRSRFEFTVDPDGRATAITIPAAAAGLGTLQRV